MRVIKLLALVVALTGVGAVVAMASGTPPAETPAASADSTGQFPHAFGERFFGKADAPVTLVEYAALTCPHCAHLHLTVMPRIKENYIDRGLVRVVFNDFPFDEIGLKAAMVARCAPPEQYYDFLEGLFGSQVKWDNPSVGDTLLKQMAGFVGLSGPQYDACVKNTALSDSILKNRVQATNDLQVNSTPTILVQGTLERLVGAQEYEEYQKVIDRQLTKLGIPLPKQLPAPVVPEAPAETHDHDAAAPETAPAAPVAP